MRLGHWERGVHTPPLTALRALRRELSVSLDELLAGELPPSAGLASGQKDEARRSIATLVRLLGLSKEKQP